MGDPSSKTVVLVSAVATVVVVVATLLLWSRVRGPGVLRVLQRLVLIGLCQVTALLTVFTAVNHEYGFYSSWGEIVDAAPDGEPTIIEGEAMPPLANPSSEPSGAPSDPSSSPAGTAPSPSAAAPDPAPFAPGPFDTLTLHLVGDASKFEGDVYVRTPPGYDPRKPGGYPVLLALGGSPGQPTDAINGLRLPEALEAAVAAGQLPPTIIVAATTNVNDEDRGCADIPGGDQVATWLTKDVNTLVRTHFAIAPDTRWSVIGLSSGGYCAGRLTLVHNDLFAAGVSLAGGNLPDGRDLRDTSEERRAYDLRTLVAAGVSRPVAFLAAASEQDLATAKDARALLKVTGPGVKIDLEIVPKGGHNFAVWAGMVPPALTWLGTHLGG